jgi:hypothetical protein
MISLQQGLNAIKDMAAIFVAQLRELNQLRDQLRTAQLSAQTSRRRPADQRRGVRIKSSPVGRREQITNGSSQQQK